MTDDAFHRHRRIWEDNARKDAKWAVMSDPARVATGWRDDEFFATGEAQVAGVMRELERSGLLAADAGAGARGTALDFGCGVGRLTRALASRFGAVVGVDVAAPMVDAAREANRDLGNCEFVADPSPDLGALAGRRFDFILSLIVVQHIPPPFGERAVAALIDRLAPGGILVLQAPGERTRTLRNAVRAIVPERAFRAKHALLKPGVPYVTMYPLPEPRLRVLAAAGGAEVALAIPDGLGGADWTSRTYYLRKARR